MADSDNKYLSLTGLTEFKSKNDAAYVGEVKVNGTALTPATRKNGTSVDITVPVQTTSIEKTSTTGYATGAQVATAIEAAVGSGDVVHNAFKTASVKNGETTTTITASGEDTIKINAGTNIGLVADASAKSITINNSYEYTLPDASADVKGGVKIDNDTIHVNANGQLYASVSSANLPTASSTVKGAVKIGSGINVDNDGVISATAESIGADPTGSADTAETNAKAYSDTNLATAKEYTDDAISGLPTPMQFKGTLGTGGTITSLPAAAKANNGFTYKVITAGTYGSITADIGDTVVSDGTKWVLIPSGDEPSGTVTNITTGEGLTGGPITSTGTISLATVGTAGTAGQTTAQTVSPGTAFTIPYVTYDAYGRVTASGTSNVTVNNPTTITNAEIDALFA